jgi:Cu(I)/Ag(I) efflux system membrane fusion protein
MAGDHLVDIADLSLVWVWAEFYQEEIPLLHKGMPLMLSNAVFPNNKFNGTIQVIDPFIQEAKRTVRVRIDVPNADFKLRPEMYVDAEVQIELGESLAIPESAVMPTGKRNVVFVDKGEGRLEPRVVELGNKAEDFYAVVSGLNAGERVVNSANFLIDAEAKIQGALKTW